MTDLTLANKALGKAKVQLLASPNTVFFTTVLFSLKFSWDEAIPTAATDGLHLKMSPDFFMSLSADEQVFLLLHETLHVVLQHVLTNRLGSRNFKKWNYAGDFVINDMLIERGFEMPAGGLHDPAYRGMSTEQVYDLIPDPPSSFSPDLEISKDPETQNQLKQEVDNILIRAAVQSKLAKDKAGTIPGEVEIYINGLLNPKLPWHQILRKWFNSLKKHDYSWRRPNRRFFPDHYLPSMYSEGLGHIAVAIDTSGSVTDDEFRQFASETHSILDKLKPELITLVQFDTEIKAQNPIRSTQDLMRVKFHGRGGTRIQPVLDWATEHKPQVLLVFTDGCFQPVNQDPKIPVIWLINNNAGWSYPFGKVIHYDI